MLLKTTKFNILASVAGALALAGLYCLLPYWLVIQGGSLPFALCFLLFCLLLHGYTALAVLSLGSIVLVLLHIANESKINLTGLPLTLLDIKLFLSNPNETRNVLKIGDGTILFILAPTLVPGVRLGMRIAQALRPNTPHRLRALSIRAAALCAVVTASILVYGAYTRAVRGELGLLATDLWKPEGVTRLSRTLGLVGFIAHSFNLEQTAPSDALLQGD